MESLCNGIAHIDVNESILLTAYITDQPEEVQEEKKAVVITARVHPGESQASWMMKGVIDYITGQTPEAQVNVTHYHSIKEPQNHGNGTK